jgi:hypothetical protein
MIRISICKKVVLCGFYRWLSLSSWFFAVRDRVDGSFALRG